ncbi:MAG: hypothetical protein U0Q18_17025 [Bryobacteraceae bacterium]
MGRPYQSELSRLSGTFDWAKAQPVDGLAKSLSAIGGSPLIVVGSGGSLAACLFAAQLRQRYAGALAKAMTPLEFSQSAEELKDAAVMVISAGGRNPDIIEAFGAAAIAEVPRIIVVGGNARSPLVTLAKRCNRADVHTFVPPSGKDGFLATNSLLGFYAILYRAQLAAVVGEASANQNLDSVLPEASCLADIEAATRELWNRDHLIILYGPSLLSIGADLESRFAEAALGTVQKADYRNFAHGQHYWLAKRSKETALLAFVSGADHEIADKTLALIPSAIPRAKIDVTGEGLASSLRGLFISLHLAGFAGLAKGIDPGRPVVPDFGRKLYHLKARSTRLKTNTVPPTDFLIRRKHERLQIASPISDSQIWEHALFSFRQRLAEARYNAVVCDYDGTLCDRGSRFLPLSKDVSAELTRILETGIYLGVATGRGKSVRARLQEALPKRFWSRVVVGYYNGGDVAMLGEDDRPDAAGKVSGALRTAANLLQADTLLSKSCQIEIRPPQISIEGRLISIEELWLRACEILSRLPSIKILCSGHSIDILGEGVSKLNLVNRIKELASGRPGELLCIGDRGRWPGNDCDLLAQPYSLSVDQCSYDPRSCWNLAPAGCSGTQATLYYLRGLQSESKQTLSFNSI